MNRQQRVFGQYLKKKSHIIAGSLTLFSLYLLKNYWLNYYPDFLIVHICINLIIECTY